MSYAKMEHWPWVQEQMRAIVRRWYSRKHSKPSERPLPPTTLTPFQRRVMDILGMVAGGIYNAPVNFEKALWDFRPGGDSFACVYCDDLATFDFSRLTLLVFLCHEARIRVEITGTAPRMMRLAFSQRGNDPKGHKFEHHPNLDEAVRWFKEEYLPKDHHIIYRDGQK